MAAVLVGMGDGHGDSSVKNKLEMKKPVNSNPNPKPSRMIIRYKGRILNTFIINPDSHTFYATGPPDSDRYKPHPLFPNKPSSISQTQINTTDPILDPSVSSTTTEEGKGKGKGKGKGLDLDHDYDSKLNLSKRKLREGYQEFNRAKKQRQIVVLEKDNTRASQCSRFKNKKLQRLYTNHKSRPI